MARKHGTGTLIAVGVGAYLLGIWVGVVRTLRFVEEENPQQRNRVGRRRMRRLR